MQLLLILVKYKIECAEIVVSLYYSVGFSLLYTIFVLFLEVALIIVNINIDPSKDVNHTRYDMLHIGSKL